MCMTLCTTGVLPSEQPLHGPHPKGSDRELGWKDGGTRPCKPGPSVCIQEGSGSAPRT